MENKEVLLTYYHLSSMAWYDSKDEKDFYSLDSAINFAKKSTGFFPPYTVYKVEVLRDENDEISIVSNEICKIPNRKDRVTTYYLLCTNLNGEKLYFNYGRYLHEILSSLDQELLDKYSDLGIFKVTCTLEDDEELSFNYELVEKIKDNNQVCQKTLLIKK